MRPRPTPYSSLLQAIALSPRLSEARKEASLKARSAVSCKGTNGAIYRSHLAARLYAELAMEICRDRLLQDMTTEDVLKLALHMAREDRVSWDA